MRWLITGAGGMLGQDLPAALAEAGENDVLTATHATLDITDPVAVQAAADGGRFVLNAAAWTDVDGAEADEKAATAVNGDAVRNLAAAAGRRLIHISTDYVFDGRATTPYAEDAPPSPVNAYGRGKAVGERHALGLAQAVFAEAGLNPARVRPTTSDRFPRPARRPAYSVLSHRRWASSGVAPPPDWRPMLTEAMPALLR